MYQEMVDAIFDAPDMAVTATYKPKAGGTISVKVIQRTPESRKSMFQTNTYQAAYGADVRKTEVAAPVEGDEITIDSDDFKVRKAVADDKKLVWLLDLEKKA